MYYRFNGISGIISLLSLIFFIFILIYFLLPLFFVLLIGFILYIIITVIFAKITGTVPHTHVKIVKIRKSVSPSPSHQQKTDYIETTLVNKKEKE